MIRTGVSLGGIGQGQEATSHLSLGTLSGPPLGHYFVRDLCLSIARCCGVLILVGVHEHTELDVAGMERGIASSAEKDVCNRTT